MLYFIKLSTNCDYYLKLDYIKIDKREENNGAGCEV